MKRLYILLAVIITGCLNLYAQMSSGQVDIFMGAEFNYRDIYHNGRVVDMLIYLTPGVKWNMGHRWEIAAQGLIPVVNQYGKQYRNPRLNIASISKQISVGTKTRFRFSGGVFSYNRYGLDVKGMFALNKAFAFAAQAGITGFVSMSDGWRASEMKRITFLAGPEVWLGRWSTWLSAKGGRFVYGDYGAEIEAYRHFKHVSVGLFGLYSSVSKENAGFSVIVMLPPYKRKIRRVNFRPASNFTLTYRNDADYHSNREYATDPEMSRREGWFDRDLLPWGPDTMDSDFITVDKEKQGKEEEK